jgi:signal transduction histidine kinase/ActR/RegA family two-component response regulator
MGGEGRAPVNERASGDELRGILHAFDEGFLLAEVIADAEGRAVDLRFLEANPAASRLTGVSAWVGRRMSELELGFGPQWLESWARVVATGDGERIEQRSSQLDGWFDCYITRVGGEGSRRAAALFQNVSERRRAQQALREADRRKDEFLAMLAHELRNPLAPIRTSVGILRAHASGDPLLVRCRDVIERQTAHMARLLEDLLDVSRLSRGTLVLQRAPVRLQEVIDAAIETSRPLIDQRLHRLTVEGVDPDIVLDGDAARLTQVFANLLNNAAKYSHPCGHIHVQVERTPERASVRVRDGGIGIPTEQQERVFDLFTQGSGAHGHAPGGLGIGLSLARRIVEMHGGTIAVASAGEGSGTELTVSLPALPDRRAVAEPVESIVGTIPRRRVLVADDNVDAADTIALLLGALGCEVRVAYGGEAAVREAELFLPELVLLDLGMPGVDGFEACRRIRGASWGAGMVVIAVSGWGQDDDRQRSAAAGFQLHLVKPVSPEELVPVLQRAGLGSDGLRASERPQ